MTTPPDNPGAALGRLRWSKIPMQTVTCQECGQPLQAKQVTGPKAAKRHPACRAKAYRRRKAQKAQKEQKEE